MKKGKTLKLNGYNLCKAMYGTVNASELKSVYINIQTWAEPKEEIDKTDKIVSLMHRSIKQSISSSINKLIFKDKFITDLDLRHGGISLGKRSFMNLEIFLYFNGSNTDFKDFSLNEDVNNIVNQIYSNNIINNDYFTFRTTKKEKQVT